jgi:DNA-binding MarR family transcriptional regulator
MTRKERIAEALAPSGNLFFILTQPELRREGLSFQSLYALQRVIEEGDQGGAYSEQRLRSETGCKDYEASRACRSLVHADLVSQTRDTNDRRIKLLAPTVRGRRLLASIMEGAGERFWNATSELGRVRRIRETIGHLRKANELLHGAFQLSFFDYDLLPGGGHRKRAPEKL